MLNARQQCDRHKKKELTTLENTKIPLAKHIRKEVALIFVTFCICIFIFVVYVMVIYERVNSSHMLFKIKTNFSKKSQYFIISLCQSLFPGHRSSGHIAHCKILYILLFFICKNSFKFCKKLILVNI